MRMRKASLKMRRLTPTRALSSLFKVDSHAASSALASSSFPLCDSSADSDVGVRLLLSFTSCSYRFSQVSLKIAVAAHPADEDVAITQYDTNLGLSCGNILQRRAVVHQANEIRLLSICRIIEKLADTVGDREDIGCKRALSAPVPSTTYIQHTYESLPCLQQPNRSMRLWHSPWIPCNS